MTKIYINFIATLLLAALLTMVLPWWSVMLAAFTTSIIFRLKKGAVFFIPFFAVALYWGIYAYVLSVENDFILAKKIAELFPLGGNPYLLIIITAFIGGFAAGAAALLGSQVKYILK